MRLSPPNKRLAAYLTAAGASFLTPNLHPPMDGWHAAALVVGLAGALGTAYAAWKDDSEKGKENDA